MIWHPTVPALVTPDPYHSIEVVRKNGLVIILFFVGFLLLISVLWVLKPSLFVRRRSGFGYSINLQDPWSWVVHLYLLIGLPLLFIYLALSHSP